MPDHVVRGRRLARAAIVVLAVLSVSAEAAPADEPPRGAPRAETPGRADVALRLVALERAIRERPEAFAAHRREVALRVSSATTAFFLGRLAAALDELAEARAVVAGEPWDPRRAALERLRVDLPPAVRASEAAARLGRVRLVPLGSTPTIEAPVRVRATWAAGTVEDAPTDAAAAPRPLADVLRDGVEAPGAPVVPGLATVTVALDGARIEGRTCVVPDDAAARVEAARALLPPRPGDPSARALAAEVGTLERLARRVARALEGKVGDLVPDVVAELERLERGARSLTQVAGAEALWRPARAALDGDTHRVTASGQPYRLFVPREPPAPPTAPAPAAPPPAGALPLVVALHGLGGNEDMYFEAYGAGEALRQAQARGWALAAPEDTGAALDVIEDLRSLLPIDERRVYLTGHSMGAGAAWRAAAEHPETFAAVACVAGGWMSLGTPRWDRLGALPVLSVTGSLDMSRALAEGTARAAAAGGARVETRLYDDLDHLLVVGASLGDVFRFFETRARP